VYISKKRLNTKIPIRRALTKLAGMGNFLSNQVCDQLGFSQSLTIEELQYSQRERLVRILTDYYTLEAKLRSQTKQAKQRLVKIKSYRGLRLRDGLPVRGQRTHTNAKTSRTRNRI